MFNLIKKMDRRGFTLIEILVATIVFTIISAVVFGVYIAGTDLWDVTRLQADLQAQARQVLNSMISELRNATRTSTQIPSPNLSIPAVPNNDSITFYLPGDNDGDGIITDANGDIEWDTGNPIIYQFDIGQKVIKRLENGQETILAQFISSVQFQDISIDPTLFLDEIKINLTLIKSTPKQRDISITASAVINFRN